MMSLIIRVSITIVVLLGRLAVAHAAPAQPYRLAVVDLRNEAAVRPSELAYLTDVVRTQASKFLPGERFLVMSRESIVALLPPGKTLADCANGECEGDVCRMIGADYVVTGEVLAFGASLRLTLKVQACRSGAFLGSAEAKGAKLDDLESGLTLACDEVFALVRMHAVSWLSGGSGTGGGTYGSIGTVPPAWTPSANKKNLVTFRSDPPGAVVVVDGSVVCASTPCSRLVAAGEMQVQMQRERYAVRSEAVTIPAGGVGATVDWALTPTFGWLTVRTTPDSLAISVNGEVVGRSPVVKREVAPGTFEVRVADERYYESGERATVATGAERVVTLVPTPREGAIEVTATDAQGNDVAGKVSVDGKPEGEAPGTFKLMVGEHRVVVTGTAGGWKGDVTVAERQVAPVVAKLVKGADLGAAGYELLADGEIVKRGDLMWTVRDNGSDVNWNEAKAYCEACRVGGYSDWRMPTIEELEALYDQKRSVKATQRDYNVHIASPFTLSTNWQWSSTLNGSFMAFGFYFLNGLRASVPLSNRDYTPRVLCVRGSGE